MKKYLGKKIFLVLVVFITFIFVSCPNQMNPTIVESDISESASDEYVFNDSSRGMAVYVDESGIETLIQSEEESGNILCSEFIDFIPLNKSESTARSVDQSSDYAKALVLGKRSDGFPGLWIVFRSGRVTPVINSDNIKTSELLNIVEFRQPLSRYFGWTYEALEMIKSEDGSEIIITGYAENEAGINSWFYSLDPGTTIGVYWAVTKDEEGLYHISRAKVIGLKDRFWWQNFRQNIDKSDYRSRYRWMWALRMFFSGWFDKYITMPDGLDFGKADGEYKIDGTDQEGDDAFAIVTARKVLSVEKEPDTGENQAPYTVVGPFPSIDYTEDTGDQTFKLEIDTQGGLADPDGDTVYFRSSPVSAWVTLDEFSGLVTVDTVNLQTADTFSFWSEDEFGADTIGDSFEITISVIEDNTLPTTKIVFASDRDGDMEIYSLDLDTDVLTQLTSNDKTDKQPVLSADGSKIAFVSDRSGDWAIHTMEQQLVNGVFEWVVSSPLALLVGLSAGNPSWSPDGTQIAYNSGLDIFTVASDGLSLPLNRTGTGLDDEIEPAWSPDGTKIAFSFKPFTEDFEIYIMGPDLSPDQPATTALTTLNTDEDRAPSWSDDGLKIVFSTNRGGDFDIYTMVSDGTGQTPFMSTAGDETSPAWSIDGTEIAYVKGEEIYIRKSDGSGGETILTNNSDVDQDPSW